MSDNYTYTVDDMDLEDGFRVNVSSKEASSESREFRPMPRGIYPAIIEDVEVKASTSAKNSGKPYYSWTLKVTDGKYQGRKLYANLMLFEGALYSIVQAMKAVGLPVDENEGLNIPGGEWWIGKEICVQVRQVARQSKNETTGKYEDVYEETADGKRVKVMTNDVAGYLNRSQWKGEPTAQVSSSTASAGASNLMP